MIAMTGASPNEVKLTTVYKQQEGEVSFGINQSLVISTNFSYRFNNYLSFSLCGEFALPEIRRRSKVIKSFGVGFAANYDSMQSLMNVEEDFSDYEFDKL